MTTDELWQAVIEAPDRATREARALEYVEFTLGQEDHGDS